MADWVWLQVVLLGPGDIVDEHSMLPADHNQVQRLVWTVEVEAAATGTTVYEIPLTELKHAFEAHKQSELGGKRTCDLIKKLTQQRTGLRAARADLMNRGHASGHCKGEPVEQAAARYNASLPNLVKYDPQTSLPVVPPPPYPAVPQRPLTAASKQRSSCVTFKPDPKRAADGPLDMAGCEEGPAVVHTPYMDSVRPADQQLGLQIAVVSTWGTAPHQKEGKATIAHTKSARLSAHPTKSSLGRVLDATVGQGSAATRSTASKPSYTPTAFKVTQGMASGVPYEWSIPTEASIPVHSKSPRPKPKPATAKRSRNSILNPVKPSEHSEQLARGCSILHGQPIDSLRDWKKSGESMLADFHFAEEAALTDSTGAAAVTDSTGAAAVPSLNLMSSLQAAAADGKERDSDNKLVSFSTHSGYLLKMDAALEGADMTDAELESMEMVDAGLESLGAKTERWRQQLIDQRKAKGRPATVRQRPVTARPSATDIKQSGNSTARSAPSTARQRGRQPRNHHQLATARLSVMSASSNRNQLLHARGRPSSAATQSFTAWKSQREMSAQTAEKVPTVPNSFVTEQLATPRTPRPSKYGQTLRPQVGAQTYDQPLATNGRPANGLLVSELQMDDQALALVHSSDASLYATTKVHQPTTARPSTARPRSKGRIQQEPSAASKRKFLRRMKFRVQALEESYSRFEDN